ncbi:MAG: ABC transporter ATP-binding protein, partial [Acutalibacteraceae bacterium]
MLELRNIVKNYVTGDTVVEALKGISVEFRENEFVSILGQSGCGKTTLLNIIGGLDGYTDGDLVINGVSTKQYKSGDWDSYRNHRIGFVFQSYNLIPHQTVLSNVELALTLSGVSKSERRKRAIEALEKVGLGDQLKKKPNQMSGGQMQRVAIARALVNDPDILLADEPTGALDSETSVQVMEILKEISKDKLIIMVTHNPELAQKYSTRIIKLLDGKIISDSSPYHFEEKPAENHDGDSPKIKKQKREKKPSMSFFTALSLSLNNLMTKKTRTFLTSFAGSIGIIGIALILSISNGIQVYIDSVQQDTLASYPITLNAEEVDLSSVVSNFAGSTRDEIDHELDAVYTNETMYEMLNSVLNADSKTNNLEAFKKYLDNLSAEEKECISAVQYGYELTPSVYTKDKDGKIVKSDIMELMSEMMGSNPMYSSLMSYSGAGFQVWQEMLHGEYGTLVNDILKDQYDV